MSDKHRHQRPNRGHQDETYIEVPPETWEKSRRALEERDRRKEERERLRERRSRQRQARRQRDEEEEEQ